MRKPSPAMIVALAALFVALGGVGVAATGGYFILGQSNSAGNTTALNSGVTTGPTFSLSNTGGKQAAKFTTNSGVAPFAVSNGTKVVNLNADLLDSHDSAYFLPKTGKAADSDKLDGVDSTGFVHGKGKTYGYAIALPRSGTVDWASPAVAPGFFNLGLLCPAVGSPVDLAIRSQNLGTSSENVFIRNDAYPNAAAGEYVPGDGINAPTNPAADITTLTLQEPTPTTQMTASVVVSTKLRSDSCHFQIEALMLNM
jgi:hypothetical protein